MSTTCTSETDQHVTERHDHGATSGATSGTDSAAGVRVYDSLRCFNVTPVPGDRGGQPGGDGPALVLEVTGPVPAPAPVRVVSAEQLEALAARYAAAAADLRREAVFLRDRIEQHQDLEQ